VPVAKFEGDFDQRRYDYGGAEDPSVHPIRLGPPERLSMAVAAAACWRLAAKLRDARLGGRDASA
jgi:hypothetical protein